MRWGSWRDPHIGRDIKVLIAVALMLTFGLTAPPELVWMTFVPLVLGGVVAVVMSFRNRRTSGEHAPDAGDVHPGINVSHISPQGFPGLVFALGMVWMFWFGLPQFRPVVVVAVILGVLLGLMLIAIEKRHRLPTSTPLGLSSRRGVDETRGNKPPGG